MGLLSKRIPTIVAILVLVLGIGGGIWMVKRQQTTGNKAEIKPQNVRITNLADNKFTVSWTTTKPTKAKVIYGKVGEKLKQVATDDRDLGETEGTYLTHHITINKLQPNTQYAFRLVEDKIQFDNNGSPYTVKTAPIISKTPPAETIYGVVKKNQTSPAKGAIVYINIPGATPLSTLVKGSGNWTVPISVARSLDLKDYIDYDSDATIFEITVTNGKKEAKAKVALKFAKPVPEMVLGQTYQFLAKAEPTPTPIPQKTSEASSSGTKGEIPKIFNIEPLSGQNETATATSAGEVTIVYPEEAETITSNQPEFRGTGPKGTTLSLNLQTENGDSLSDTVAITDDGSWSWVPTNKLADGNYLLTVGYLNTDGQEESLERSFNINTEGETPAFEASQSGTATAEASPRVSMPSTESGVPVTGSWQETVLTLTIGFGIMILGSLLLI